jgi:hypothetical protein
VTAPLDTLAALVAAVLLRRFGDPLLQVDPRVRGSFAYRVEQRLLAELYERHGRAWNRVAHATRGGPINSTIQRVVARHLLDLSVRPPHKPLDDVADRFNGSTLADLLRDDREPTEWSEEPEPGAALTERSAAVVNSEACALCGERFQTGRRVVPVLGGKLRHESCQKRAAKG